MAIDKQTVLIIEDDLDVAEMLNEYFRGQGYEVLTADWGEDGVRTAIGTPPDLIILDIRLPDIDGFEVARKLRANRRTKHIPILFLTEKRQRIDRIKGLELGADDYITKPFDIHELRLRVRNALRRAAQGPLTNPATGLPEGEVVEANLQGLIEAPDGRSLMVFRVVNLDKFRDSYGFVAANDALKAISVMIGEAAGEVNPEQTFVGHIAAETLVMATPSGAVAPTEKTVMSRLSQTIDMIYPLSAHEGGVSIPNRIQVAVGYLAEGAIRGATDPATLKEMLVDTIA